MFVRYQADNRGIHSMIHITMSYSHIDVIQNSTITVFFGCETTPPKKKKILQFIMKPVGVSNLLGVALFITRFVKCS